MFEGVGGAIIQVGMALGIITGFIIAFTSLGLFLEKCCDSPAPPTLAAHEELVFDRLLAAGYTRKAAHRELIARRAILGEM